MLFDIPIVISSTFNFCLLCLLRRLRHGSVEETVSYTCGELLIDLFQVILEWMETRTKVYYQGIDQQGNHTQRNGPYDQRNGVYDQS